MNRSKALGTYAETAVVRVARGYGFPWADRVALHGRADVGDVSLCPGVMVEVKGGAYARTASRAQIEDWLDETQRERDNANALVGFLVLQTTAIGAGNAHMWRAVWRLGWVADLDDRPWTYARHMAVTATLGESLLMLRAAGYGDPVP